MRTNIVLKRRLNKIWSNFFADVPRNNLVQIKFGRKARKRLGSIKETKCPIYADRIHSEITINGHFKNKKLPLFIIDATIAHELCHYAHGFGSPLPQLCVYPHRGGFVDKEMTKRQLESLTQREQIWLNKNWLKFIEEHKEN